MTRFLFWAALSAILASSAPAQSPTGSGKPILYYGADRIGINEAEFDAWRRVAASFTPELAPPSIEAMVLQKSLAAEARRHQLQESPALQMQLDLMRANWLQPKYRARVADSVETDPDEVERIYRLLRKKPPKPRKVRLYNIFKRFPPDAGETEKQPVRMAMKRVVDELEAGTEFKDLASVESESQSRLRQGLIGNVPAGFLKPEMDKVAMALNTGEVSDVVETKDGLTLLYAERVFESIVVEDSVIRERARGRVHRKAFDAAWQAFQADLQRRADININWPMLDQNKHIDVSPDAVFARFSLGTVTWAQARWLLSLDTVSGELQQHQKVALQSRLEQYTRGKVALELAAESLPQWADELEQITRFLTNKLLSEHLLTRLVNERFTALEESEIKAFYEENRMAFMRPAHYHLSAMTWLLDPENPLEAYEKAGRVHHQLNTNAISFDAAVERHALSSSAAGSGDLGWIPRPDLAGRIGIDPLKAVLNLSVGQFTDLTRSDDGRLWIIHLTDLQARRPYTYPEARLMAKQALGQSRMSQTEQSVLSEWMTQQAIEYVSH